MQFVPKVHDSYSKASSTPPSCAPHGSVPSDPRPTSPPTLLPSWRSTAAPSSSASRPRPLHRGPRTPPPRPPRRGRPPPPPRGCRCRPPPRCPLACRPPRWRCSPQGGRRLCGSSPAWPGPTSASCESSSANPCQLVVTQTGGRGLCPASQQPFFHPWTFSRIF